MSDVERLVARALLNSGALLFGEFRLASGGVSHVYVDLRRVLGSPRHFKAITSLLAGEVAKLTLEGDLVVAGVATGGIPWATAVAMTLGLPLAYVRPPKGHGTERSVEGADVKGKTVALVDDVATSGGSLLSSASALKSMGASSVTAIVVVDREQGATEALAGVGVRLRGLASLRSVLQEAFSEGVITKEQLDAIVKELWGTRPS